MASVTTTAIPLAKARKAKLLDNLCRLSYALPDGTTGKVKPSTLAAVLRFFVHKSNLDGEMKYGAFRSTVAAYTLLHTKTVDRALDVLIRLGYITRVTTGGGGKKPSHYRANLDTITTALDAGNAPTRPTHSARPGNGAADDETSSNLNRKARTPHQTPAQKGGQLPGKHHQTPRKKEAASVNPAPPILLEQLRLPQGTVALSPDFDCGHGLDVRCAPTASGKPSCFQCRSLGRTYPVAPQPHAAADLSPTQAPTAGSPSDGRSAPLNTSFRVTLDANKTKRRQPTRTSRRQRRQPNTAAA